MGGSFDITRLPLFAGENLVEVVVSGVGAGQGENRCAADVISSQAEETGLRAILTWDGTTGDLDIHVIGPGGQFGSPASDLSSRLRHPTFGGRLQEASMGLGPEIAQVDPFGDGVWGIVVEPVFDDMDPGENAIVRLLFNGHLMVRGPIGPTHVSSEDGNLWIVGTITVASGVATFKPLGDLVPGADAPTTPPSMWPTYH
jgi:hypothetical protein